MWLVINLHYANKMVLIKYLTYLLLFVTAATQANSQTITCQVYGGNVFVWAGPTCPTGSIRVFV